MKNSSKAFEEFIYKRCEEILAEDKEANDANEKIYIMGQRFKSKLSPELLKEFLEIESESIKSNARNDFKIYRQAFFDRFDL